MYIPEGTGELFELWKQAESILKKTEHLGDIAFIPAINELRYVGFHFILSLQEKNEKKQWEFNSAILHVKRAIRDCAEIGVEILIKKIRLFLDDYKLLPKGNIIPDYGKKISTIRLTHSRFIHINKYKAENKDKHFKELVQHLDTLIEIYFVFDGYRDDLTKKLKLWRIWFVFSLVGVIAAVISVLILAFG